MQFLCQALLRKQNYGLVESGIFSVLTVVPRLLYKAPRVSRKKPGSSLVAVHSYGKDRRLGPLRAKYLLVYEHASIAPTNRNPFSNSSMPLDARCITTKYLSYYKSNIRGGVNNTIPEQRSIRKYFGPTTSALRCSDPEGSRPSSPSSKKPGLLGGSWS
jgi:hypothetical protein